MCGIVGAIRAQDNVVDFLTDGLSISIKTTVENKNSQDTQIFLNEIKSYFKKFASSPAWSREKIIYENTKVTSENNQVFIVTRLPRGSLDELLKNAKAESK